MKWIDVILDAVAEKTEDKSDHSFTLQDVYEYISTKNIQNKFESVDWEATVRRTIYDNISDSENVRLFKKTDKNGIFKLDDTSSVEIRQKIVQFANENSVAITRKEAYSKLIESQIFRPADFIKRPSRNNEFWFKQNVGNALRISSKIAKEHGIKLIDLNGEKAIAPDIQPIVNEIKPLDQKTNIPRMISNTVNSYQRNQFLAKQMKVIANYSCEMGCDMSMRSFKDSENKWYVETHHIIPMGLQSIFDRNIDVRENMVVLCPHHHKLIHQASMSEKQKMIDNIFSIKFSDDKNMNFLLSIKVDKKKLIEIYKGEKFN